MKNRAGLSDGGEKWTSCAGVVAVGCCAAAAAPAGSMERRADCRAKFVSSAKRTSDREARNAVEYPLCEVWDDVCAVERSVVVVLLVDERGESWATTGGKLD